MNGGKLFNTFQLNDQSLFNEQVDALPINPDVLELDTDRYFFLGQNASQCEFMFECLSIYAFQKPGPEKPMNLDCGADNRVSKAFVLLRYGIEGNHRFDLLRVLSGLCGYFLP